MKITNVESESLWLCLNTRSACKIHRKPEVGMYPVSFGLHGVDVSELSVMGKIVKLNFLD